MAEKSEQSILFDEVLEVLFMMREDNKKASAGDLLSIEHCNHRFSLELLERVADEGLTRRINDSFELTDKGLKKATRILRCHRLAERLLVDVLNAGDEIVESSACHFEHILSEEIVDSICTLLGHPRTCPHGKSISPGLCCRRAEKEIFPILKALSKLSPGDDGEIAYISSRFHERLSRLASLGISPGRHIIVRQVKPSYIIAVGESEIALEEKVAEEIFLRISTRGPAKGGLQ